LSGAALPSAGLWAGSASAIPLIGCPTHAVLTTCTFSYTGSATNWTVPAGVTHLTIGADGGSGASAGSTPTKDADTGRDTGGTGGNGGETTVDGIRLIPLADTDTHSGDGVVIISYERVPTHLTAYIAFNIFQTFTVSGRLDRFSGPAVGQPLIFRSGHTFLCVAITNSHGIGSCVLSYYKSVAIRQNAGRFTVIFPGSAGYLGSIALGQAIIHDRVT
jgi:hypothetical protein